MSPHLSNAVRYVFALRRARRRRGRKPVKRVAARRKESRPARAPQVLTLSSRRIPRRTMPEAVVPYLRLSGRWLAEHGFAIGANVQVVVEQSRVTLVSHAPSDCRDRPADTNSSTPASSAANVSRCR